MASGKGTDYQVGPNAGQLASLDQVPWESLKAGDTVRIFYSANPYRGHMLLAASGTASAPVRVCGVKGPNGERPIIDGNGAVARRGLSYTSASMNNIQESRAIIMVDRLGTQGNVAPSYIQIDGLHIRSATPSYTFTNSKGTVQPYESFGACIWIERGQNVTIADNIVTDCTNGIMSRSIDLGMGMTTITSDLRLVGNYIYGNGAAYNETVHNVYIQSLRATYEFNYFGPLRANAGGNAIKDRSVGTVVRYNYIAEGAHSIDLVEPEDFATTAAANYPTYADTFVYGNVINKNGDGGTFIHYGGDHIGSEAIFRPGKLYFYHNTVYANGGWNRMFQLSTTRQTAEVWNNVISSPSGVDIWLRGKSEVAAGWTEGGVTNLGKNFIKSTWGIHASPWHTVAGTVNGVSNILTNTVNPLSTSTFRAAAGTQPIDSAQANPVAVSAHPVLYQPATSFGTLIKRTARTQNGIASDMGAFEN